MNYGFREECGVFGTINNLLATENCILCLHALQHRGHEAFGVVTRDDSSFAVYHYEGCVHNKIDDAVFKKSTAAVGHVRYSTSGSLNLKQPIYAKLSIGEIAVAHNGNLTNADLIRERLMKLGSIFQSDVDSEVFIHLIATSVGENIIERLMSALKEVVGAYSLVVLSANCLIGIRDKFGIRPLVLGKLDGSYIFVSETCALDIIGATFIRDVLPGEMIVIDDKNNILSYSLFDNHSHSRFCIFEYIYFARPDSFICGKNVYQMRKKIGTELAKEHPVDDVDFIVPVLDSGMPAALGYAYELNIPLECGIIRNHYIGRTFIQPNDYIRNLGVKLKHNPNRYLLDGKNIVLIDDSIVRGTTIKNLVLALKDSGAKKVHIRIASPQVKNPCFYGIDTPSKKDLVSANYSIKKMSDMFSAESLAFISIDGVYKAILEEVRNSENIKFCDACFTGDYPV